MTAAPALPSPHNPPGFSNQAGPGRDFLPGRGQPERDFAERRAALRAGQPGPRRSVRSRSRSARLGKLRLGKLLLGLALYFSSWLGPERYRTARSGSVRCGSVRPGWERRSGEWGRRLRGSGRS